MMSLYSLILTSLLLVSGTAFSGVLEKTVSLLQEDLSNYKKLNQREYKKRKQARGIASTADPNLASTLKKTNSKALAQLEKLFADRGIDIDLNGDGKADAFKKFDRGRLAEFEVLFFKSRRVRYRKLFASNGETKEYWDRNNDAKFEEIKKCDTKGTCQSLLDRNNDGIYEQKEVVRFEAGFKEVSIYKKSKKTWKLREKSRSKYSTAQTSTEGGLAGCLECLEELSFEDLESLVSDYDPSRISYEKIGTNQDNDYRLNKYGFLINRNCDSNPGRDSMDDMVKETLGEIVSCAKKFRNMHTSEVVQGLITERFEASLVKLVSSLNPADRPKLKCYSSKKMPTAVGAAYAEQWYKASLGNEQTALFEGDRPPIVLLRPEGSMSSTYKHELFHIMTNTLHGDGTDITENCTKALEQCSSGQYDEHSVANLRACIQPKQQKFGEEMEYYDLNGRKYSGARAMLTSFKDEFAKDGEYRKSADMVFFVYRDALKATSEYLKKNNYEIGGRQELFLSTLFPAEQRNSQTQLKDEIKSYLENKRVELSGPVARFYASALKGEDDLANAAALEILGKIKGERFVELLKKRKSLILSDSRIRKKIEESKLATSEVGSLREELENLRKRLYETEDYKKYLIGTFSYNDSDFAYEIETSPQSLNSLVAFYLETID